MLSITVIGRDDADCQCVEDVVLQAVETLGAPAEIARVVDGQDPELPRLLVNGYPLVSGRVPEKAEALGWLTAALIAGS